MNAATDRAGSIRADSPAADDDSPCARQVIEHIAINAPNSAVIKHHPPRLRVTIGWCTVTERIELTHYLQGQITRYAANSRMFIK